MEQPLLAVGLWGRGAASYTWQDLFDKTVARGKKHFPRQELVILLSLFIQQFSISEVAHSP